MSRFLDRTQVQYSSPRIRDGSAIPGTYCKVPKAPIGAMMRVGGIAHDQKRFSPVPCIGDFVAIGLRQDGAATSMPFSIAPQCCFCRLERIVAALRTDTHCKAAPPEARGIPVRGIPARSIYGWFIIDGKKSYIAVNGRCTAYERDKMVVGCGVTASQTAFVQESTIGLYTRHNAKGCVFALANYRGEIHAGSVIPAKYQFVNNTCARMPINHSL